MGRHEWAAALAAMVGITAADGPLLFSIMVGLLGGTLAAWPRDRDVRRQRRISWSSWLVERLMLWVAVLVICLAAHDLTGMVTPRVAGALAVLLVFGGVDVIDRLAQRAAQRAADMISPGDQP